MKRNLKTFNRYFSAILYEEDTRFEELLDFIKKNYTEVTYIKHNRDINEDGSVKKAHYHCVFKVGENARSVKSIAEEMQYTIACIERLQPRSNAIILITQKQPRKNTIQRRRSNGRYKAFTQIIKKINTK